MRKVLATVCSPICVTLCMAALVPGMRYFFPMGNLFWFRAFCVLTLCWALYCGYVFLHRCRYATFHPLVRGVLMAGTAVLLLHPIVFFGFLLAVFYRWILLCMAVGLIPYLLWVVRRVRRRIEAVLVFASWIPLLGMLASWWNFNMIGSGSFEASRKGGGICPLVTVEQIRRTVDGVGEAHPYAMAYDTEADILIASFKDDWGAVFPRLDTRKHNFLLSCSTRGDPRILKTLFLGRHQIPENLALRPEEGRGWVDVLDFEKRTFHVATFRYGQNSFTWERFASLPVEPNGIFDDPIRNRLLIVGINRNVLELDPHTLEIRKRIDLSTRLVPVRKRLNRLLNLSHEFCVLASLFEPETNSLIMGTMGSYVHALNLTSMDHRRAPSFPMVVGLDVGEDGRILAAQPFQRRVLMLDPESLRIRRRIDVSVPVRPVASIPGTELLVAGAYSRSHTVVVDMDNGNKVADFDIGRLQRDAIPDTVGKRVFVATGLGLFAIDAEGLAEGTEP